MKSFLTLLMLIVLAASLPAADGPQFDFAHWDGLYATVTLPQRIEKPAVEHGESIKLDVPGFRKEVQVRALWQTDAENGIKRAPLAVALPGIAGSNKDNLARLWQGLLFETGCHVLTVDSSFSNHFNKASGQGVAGNIAAEATALAKLIETFVNTPEARDKVTEVRLLGASYGGNDALYLAHLNKENKLHFPLGVVVALSPLVSPRATARIVDDFYDQDFASYNYNRAKLVKLTSTPVVSPEGPVPFQPRLMRAGIGYWFHHELQRIARKNDHMYHLGLLNKHAQADDKRGWTFTQFVEEMSYPYWRQRGDAQSIDEFWSMGALETLLTDASNNVFVYLSKDDPLNDPADVAALQSRFKAPVFNVLPGGGHLGFANSEWMKTIVMKRFGTV